MGFTPPSNSECIHLAPGLFLHHHRPFPPFSEEEAEAATVAGHRSTSEDTSVTLHRMGMMDVAHVPVAAVAM